MSIKEPRQSQDIFFYTQKYFSSGLTEGLACVNGYAQVQTQAFTKRPVAHPYGKQTIPS
jgi:hypothetical protein